MTRNFRTAAAMCALLASFGPGGMAQAKIPEPHHVIYGSVRLDGAPVTRGRVDLYLPGGSGAAATYAVGSIAGADGRYVLRVPMDSVAPYGPGTARPGDGVEIYVNGLWGGRTTVGAVGSLQTLDVEASTVHRITFQRPPTGAPNPADAGGAADVGVLARDSLGHPLLFAWSALCPGLPNAGSFGDASLPATIWTAPVNLTGSRQACTISVLVSDGQGLAETRSYSQGVLSAPDRVSLVSGPSGTPDPVSSGGAVTLAATGADTLGHALRFAWAASCPGLDGSGSFATTGVSTVWTAPRNFTGEQAACTVQVSASDGLGQAAEGSYVQKVNADPHSILITSPAAGNPDSVPPGGVVSLGVAATDSQGHPVKYAWRALCVGLAGNGSFDSAASRTPHWTAPGKIAPEPGECRVEVQISDGLGVNRWSGYRQVVSNTRPVAVAAASAATVSCPGELTFDGSGSYHPDPARRIVRWEWDFHFEEGAFRTEAVGRQVAYAFGDVGAHTVALRVTDESAIPASDIATLEVQVDGAAPVASAGGPYVIGYGAPLALDAAGSADPDAACGDRVTAYAWDLDGDGEFDDASGAGQLLGWGQVRDVVCGGACVAASPYPVAVRVTDRLGLTGEAAATVTIGALDVPIRLTAPNGGEVLGTGRETRVQFVSDAAVDAVQVLLSRGKGGTWRAILPSGAFREDGVAEGGSIREGSRSWSVPLSLGGTYRNYVMRVVGFAGGAVIGIDESDRAFGVGPVEMVAPKAGDVLTGGRWTTVRWSLFGAAQPVSVVRIRYTLDGGATWRQAGIARPQAGEFAWRVPFLRRRSTSCRAMVELLSARGTVIGRDLGAGPFTVTGGVDLLGPEAGDAVYGGTGRLVAWRTTATGTVARAVISLSLDGGATWTGVATVAGNPGEYAWNAPQVTEENARCRFAVTLYSARNAVITRDEGEGLFSLVPRP